MGLLGSDCGHRERLRGGIGLLFGLPRVLHGLPCMSWDIFTEDTRNFAHFSTFESAG